jgi:hypothetical protein
MRFLDFSPSFSSTAALVVVVVVVVMWLSENGMSHAIGGTCLVISSGVSGEKCDFSGGIATACFSSSHQCALLSPSSVAAVVG